jgi:hypothetical protein
MNSVSSQPMSSFALPLVFSPNFARPYFCKYNLPMKRKFGRVCFQTFVRATSFKEEKLSEIKKNSSESKMPIPMFLSQHSDESYGCPTLTG